MTRGDRLRGLVRPLLFVLPVLALIGVAVPVPSFAAAVTVSGQVTDGRSGLPVAGSTVVATSPTGATLDADTTDSSGRYSLTVSVSPIDLVVTPPAGSDYGPVRISDVAASTNQIVNVTLAPAEAVEWSGMLRDGTGTAVLNTKVELLAQPSGSNVAYTVTNPDGHFTLRAPAGNYKLHLAGGPTGTGQPNIDITTAAFTLDTDRTTDLNLPTHTVDVRVLGPSGNPVPNARITLGTPILNTGSLAPGLPITNSTIQTNAKLTDTDGRASLQLLSTPTSPASTAYVEAPTDSALTNTQFDLTNLTSDRHIDVAMSRGIEWSGMLRDGTGTAVLNTKVELLAQPSGSNVAYTVTNPDGHFTLRAPAGNYKLHLAGGPTGTGQPNIDITTAAFTLDTDRTTDLNLPTHTVDVRVLGPSGNPVPNARITLGTPILNTGSLAPGLPITNSTIQTNAKLTDTDGRASLQLLSTPTSPASTAYVEAPTDSALTNTQFDLTNLTSDRHIDVAMSRGIEWSGMLRDGTGTAVLNTKVELLAQPSGSNVAYTVTNPDGHFTLRAPAGNYKLHLAGGPTGTGQPNIDITTAAFTLDTDRTTDLNLPTHTVDVRVLGPSGNPVPNARITLGTPILNTGSLAPGLPITNSTIQTNAKLTDTDGRASLQLLSTPTSPASTAYVEAPTDSALTNTQFDLTNLTSDRTAVISFSRSSLDPTAPTVTCAPFPTAWSATNLTTTCVAADAGVGLRTPADAQFELTTAVEPGSESANAAAGPRQVCDKADNCIDATASGAKVDRAAPAVVFDRTNGGDVPRNAVVTLAYTCTDGGSGTASCEGSQPTGAALDTSTLGDHSVTVTTTDKVGNERTATFAYRVVADPDAGGGKAKLALSNTVSPAEALPGDTVTYTLTATNGTGAGVATGTVVTDVLPAGVTFLDASEGCANDAGTVRCQLGSVAAGSSMTATIRAIVDAMPMRPDPNTAHQVLEQKAETDLRVEKGGTRTATATCPSGYFATDGGIRLDAVDQGGDLARTSVPTSGVTADGSGWTATLTNDNPGAALAKVTVACLARTTVTGNHQHDLVTTSATAADEPLATGSNAVTVDCAPGQTPFAPSYDVGPGALVTASRADGSSWTFDVTAASPETGDFSVNCLDPRTTSAAGHYHVLGIEQRSQTVTVPAGQTVETQLTCADEAKGIVASRRVDAGLVDRGTDPRAKIRAFRLTNPTDHELTADLGLTCLDIRTSGEPVSATIRNTAVVSTTAPDTTAADDSATATFTAYGDGWAILPTGTAAVGSHGRSVSVPLRCASDCSVTARITGAGGKVLGSGRANLAAGSTARLTVRTTHAGAKALAGHRVTRAKVVVRTSDGATYSRVVHLHR